MRSIPPQRNGSCRLNNKNTDMKQPSTETSFDTSTKQVLSIALLLIEQGKSTVDTAFVDALNLIERHTIEMINYLSIKDSNFASYDNPDVYDSRVCVQLSTPFSLKPYEGVYDSIKSAVYNKIKKRSSTEMEAA